MKAKDLMIGDYILVNGVPRKVCLIYSDGVKIAYKVPHIKGPIYARLNECEPIRVDDSLLKRLGVFKKSGYKHLEPNKDWRMAIEEYGNGHKMLHFEFGGSYCCLRNFEYLHQLQNIIKMFGLGWELFILDEPDNEPAKVSEEEFESLLAFVGKADDYKQ